MKTLFTSEGNRIPCYNRHYKEKRETHLLDGMELWSINKHHDLCSIRFKDTVLSTWHPSRSVTRKQWVAFTIGKFQNPEE